MTGLQRLLCAALRAHLDGARLKVPEGAGPLWVAFVDLSAARSYGAIGPNPISFTEIEAYARLMNLPLQAHHVETLRAMDAVFLDHVMPKGARAPDGVKSIPPRSRQALSPALFDAALG